jgi:hypothetical protein
MRFLEDGHEGQLYQCIMDILWTGVSFLQREW